MGTRRLNTCPQCSGAGTIGKPTKREVQLPNGDKVVETVVVQVDCPTCDGSGQVVDFDG